MDKALRVLNVEDSERDVSLLRHHLESAGYALTTERVQTADAMTAALEAKEWDVILCDYSMPQFNALAATNVLKDSGHDIPLIIISGTVGEEIAVEALLSGANDYIPKGNLARLVPAIERELLQAENRREKRQADLERRRSDDRYRALFEYAPDGIIISSPDDYYLDANLSMCNMLGYTHKELIGLHARDIVIRSEAQQLDSEFALVQSMPDYNREWHFRRKDGSVFPAEVIATIMPDGNLLAMIRDVSERNHAVEELRESEERFSGAFELAPIGVALVLPDGKWLKVNRALCDLVGYAEAELLAGRFQDITHPEDLALDLDNMRRLADGEIDHYQIEKRYKHKLGHFISILLNVSLVRNTDGKPRYFISQIQDITARKLAEKELRESEYLLAASQRITHLGSWVLDLTESADGKKQSERWSDEHYRIFGFEPGQIEITDEVFYNSVHPDDRERLAKKVREAIEQKKSFDIEHRIILPDGSERTVQAMAEVVLDDKTGNPLKLIGSVQDITERKSAEAALRESNEKFQQLADNISDVFWIRSPDMAKIYYISPAYEKIWGRSLESDYANPHEWYDFIYPADRQKVKETYAALMHDAPSIEVEYRISRPDGEIRWVRARGFQVLDAEGSLIRLAGIVSDITESKKAVQELEDSEERYRDLVENAIDVIYTLDLNGNYTSMNKAGERLSGYAHDVSLTRNIADSILPEYREKAKQMISAQIDGHDISAFEIEIAHKDGRHIALEVNTRPIKENGITVGVQGIARDITERKIADAEIKEKSALLEAQLNSSIDGILIVDQHGKQIIQNQRMVDIFKIPQQIADDSDDSKQVQWVTPLTKDPDKFVERVLYLYSNPDEISRDEIELKDGTVLDRYTAPVLGKDGKNYGRIWTFRDITDRNKAEALLRESSERLALATESVNLGIWDWDVTENKLEWDDRMYELYGIRADEFSGAYDAWQKGLHPDDREQGDANIQAALRGERPFSNEFRVLWPNGEMHYIEARALVERDKDGAATRMIGVNWDITERKRAEELLRKSEIQYRTLFDGVMDGIYRTTHDGRFVDLNDAMVKIFGYSSKEEMLQVDIAKDLYFEEGDRESHFPDNATSTIATYRMRTKNGSEIWVEDHGQYIYDEQGNVVFHEGTLRDITERKRADDMLRILSTAVEQAGDSILITDAELNLPGPRIVFVNPAYTKMTGYTYNEAIGTTPRLLQGPKSDREVLDRLRDNLERGEAFSGEIINYRKDGREYDMEWQVTPIRSSGGEISNFVAIQRDVTERKALEEQFRQSQKMEAVGVLAGGIAHDFNNLLTAINGFSALTLRKMPVGDPLRHNVEEVKKAGDRAAELTSQLLAFSRKQVLKPTVLNLNTIITNIEKMLRRIIRESVELHVSLDPELGNIRADHGQIEQVIMNLAINARDAMPEGGTLTIETNNIFLDDAYVSQHIAVTPGHFVKITVTDIGEGMDTETQSHIFEPFFTTKGVGKGTGLGLSTVYGIVKQSGGDILVYSEIGHGTTFKIYLPCVDEVVQKPKWVDDRKEQYAGTETILLVEDEENVRKLVFEILSDNGYKVLEADSGKAALTICNTFTEPIHMMVTDVIMPKMGGGDLKDEIVKLRSDIKVLFMSGYTNDALTQRGMLGADIAFIGKPFTPDEFSRKVREVLDH